jgi:hypothetical protein
MLENPIYIELYKNAYKRGYDPPQEQILFTIQGQNIGSIQNYCIISGLPKSGKSTFTTSIVASAFHTYDIFDMKLQTLPKRPKILYIDTESSEFDFYKHMARIKNVGNIDELPSFFDSFCLRKESPETIKLMIKAYLENTPECSIIILDGLLDIVMNYNDEVECRKVVNWIKEITTVNNLLLIGILHTGKNEGKTLGHLGSNTDRWAQSTLSVRKEENGTFVLEPKFLRSAGGFKAIQIEYSIDENKFIQINSIPVNEVKIKHFSNYTDQEHNNILNSIFEKQKFIKYDILVNEISKIEKRGVNFSKSYIKYFKDKNLISKNLQNEYFDYRQEF